MHVGRGDCGTWVTDLHDDSLYGYITAGDPNTSIAYIIPAFQALRDIGQATGNSVTFSHLEYDSDASDDEYPTVWDSSGCLSEPISSKTCLSSRATTLSEGPHVHGEVPEWGVVSPNPMSSTMLTIENQKRLNHLFPSTASSSSDHHILHIPANETYDRN
jgi:hypothetical protein